jgi:hypothetical protein
VKGFVRMKKEISKAAIEEATCSDVGSLLEIRKVFSKYDKYSIDYHPNYVYMEQDKYQQLRDLIEMGNSYSGKTDVYLDKKYIIGVNPSYNRDTKKFEFCTLSTNELDILLSLIRLVKEPIDWDNLSSSFDEKEILNWCEKYTLPDTIDDEVQFCNGKDAKFLYRCMPLDQFQEITVELYLLFNLWYSSSMGNDADAKKHASKLAELLKDYDITKESAYDILLSVFIDKRLKNINMRFINFGTNKFYLDTDNVFSMCFFQLSNIITKPIESKKHLKICKGCKTMYWGHGNSGYCNHCDRRTVWSRTKRKGDKQEDLNK